MADFVSSYWSWYITIPTVLGLLGCLWLLLANTHRKPGDSVETMGHVWDEDLQEYDHPLPRWWLNMFLITLIFAGIYLLLYPGLGAFKGLLGWTELGEYEAEMAAADAEFGPLYAQYADTGLQELSGNQDAMRTGARLFSTYCATCHGADARGALGFPNLRDGEWLWGDDPDAIKTTILQGRNAVMPPWGAALGDDGVLQVAEYVRSLSGSGGGDSGVLSAGKQHFDTLCVSCHGPEGKGNPQLGAPDLTNDVWLYGGSQQAISETLRDGRNGRMPAFGEFLGEERVHLLAAYAHSLKE